MLADLDLLLRAVFSGADDLLIGDKGCASSAFEDSVPALGARILRPRRINETGRDPHLAPIRQRIESIFWTCKDILTLKRHGARTLHALRTRIACRFLALTTAVAPNHQLGRPTRAIADLTA